MDKSHIMFHRFRVAQETREALRSKSLIYKKKLSVCMKKKLLGISARIGLSHARLGLYMHVYLFSFLVANLCLIGRVSLFQVPSRKAVRYMEMVWGNKSGIYHRSHRSILGRYILRFIYFIYLCDRFSFEVTFYHYRCNNEMK